MRLPLALPLLAAALVFTSACRTDRDAADAPTCTRRPLPAFPVGANVVDLPDDQDADSSNDGARGYGSAAAARTLDRLQTLGLNGVVLPVLLSAASKNAKKVTPGPLLVGPGRARLGRMIDQAHARDLIVVLAPHLVLEDGGWRGRLEPGPGFFASYTAAVVELARVGEEHCAEVLSAGVELKSLTDKPAHDEGFRALARSLRSAFSGELIYSANWDEVEHVRHWPLFDRIGVNAFFPLASVEGARPEELSVRAGEWHAQLLRFKERVGKPLWFVEVGFKATPESWREPWLWPADVGARKLPLDTAAQAAGYRAVRDAFYSVPAVDAAFFWVVPSDPDDGTHAWSYEPPQGFSFLGKPAEQVVRDLAAHPPPRGRYDGSDG